jgi:hypothetical protein
VEGRYTKAEKIARETYDVRLRTLGSQHPDTLDTLRQLGRAMAYSHRYAEASNLFHDVIEKGTITGRTEAAGRLGMASPA